jgi:hypothetical protein
MVVLFENLCYHSFWNFKMLLQALSNWIFTASYNLIFIVILTNLIR